MARPWMGGETKRIYAVLIVGLVIWAAVHAIGAAINGRQPWAGAVVVASFVLYLTVWMVLLARRNKRIATRVSGDSKPNESGGHRT